MEIAIFVLQLVLPITGILLGLIALHQSNEAIKKCKEMLKRIEDYRDRGLLGI